MAVDAVKEVLRDGRGITSFTQCIMPDAGGRIKDSSINSMSGVLLTLTSFYNRPRSAKTPKMNVIFTNISKNPVKEEKVDPYGDETDEKIVSPTWEDYIKDYKKLLAKAQFKYYEEMIPLEIH